MRAVVFWLSLVLIFFIPLENVAILPGLGRISRIAGLALAALWVINVAFSGRMPRLLLTHIFMLLFVLWKALSVWWSIDVSESVERFMTYLQLFGMVLIISDL